MLSPGSLAGERCVGTDTLERRMQDRKALSDELQKSKRAQGVTQLLKRFSECDAGAAETADHAEHVKLREDDGECRELALKAFEHTICQVQGSTFGDDDGAELFKDIPRLLKALVRMVPEKAIPRQRG